jgi:hypothetical protein
VVREEGRGGGSIKKKRARWREEGHLMAGCVCVCVYDLPQPQGLHAFACSLLPVSLLFLPSSSLSCSPSFFTCTHTLSGISLPCQT